MASLKRIEELSQRLGCDAYGIEPKWIRGYTKRDNHLSGALRNIEERMSDPDISLDDIEMDIRALLEEAAETLDDAHEEWLNNQLAARDLIGDIDAMRDRDQGTNWFGGFSEWQADDQICNASIEWPNLEISATKFVTVVRGGDYEL